MLFFDLWFFAIVTFHFIVLFCFWTYCLSTTIFILFKLKISSPEKFLYGLLFFEHILLKFMWDILVFVKIKKLRMSVRISCIQREYHYHIQVSLGNLICLDVWWHRNLKSRNLEQLSNFSMYMCVHYIYIYIFW